MIYLYYQIQTLVIDSVMVYISQNILYLLSSISYEISTNLAQMAP